PARRCVPASGTHTGAGAPACPQPWCARAREHAGGANPAIACELLPMPQSFLLITNSCQGLLTGGASPAPAYKTQVAAPYSATKSITLRRPLLPPCRPSSSAARP